MDAALGSLGRYDLPDDFVFLIEGPVRSLDGAFFDLTRDAEADREVIRRAAQLASRIGARAVNIHAIAPTADADSLQPESRREALERAVGLVRYFTEVVLESGAVPAIENMPPVLRMRESGFFYSPLGMPAEDLVWLCERAPGLRTTLDLSHAGLYLNCRRTAESGRGCSADDETFRPLFDFVRGLPLVADVQAYAKSL